MTGVELGTFYRFYVGHCRYFGCQNPDSPCFICSHKTAMTMYLLGLNMLETGENPLI